MLKLPHDFESYISQIKERCEDFISLKIWAEVDRLKLNQWFRNFETNEERYFAACVLDNLIFRTEEQTEALLYSLFHITIPNLVRQHPLPSVSFIENWVTHFSSHTEPNIRFVCSTNEDSPPTKSGYLIARLMRRRLKIKDQWFIKPEEIESTILHKGIKIFFFIDDFVGTGHQFDDVLTYRQINLNRYLKDINYYFAYVPLVAHQTGMTHLTNLYPFLKMSAAEILDEQNSLAVSIAQDGSNSIEDVKNFYRHFLQKKGVSVAEHELLGYGNLGLTYVFQHATPDNNLQLLWWNRDECITPLFNR